MKRIYPLLFFILSCFNTNAQSKYQKDFDTFWDTIYQHYAYLSQQQIDWNKVKKLYNPQVATITSNQDFIRLLENMLIELHNGHSSLNVNLKSSNRLVPSGQDIYAEEKRGKFWVSDIKKGSNAEKAGLKIGAEIVKFNGDSLRKLLPAFLPKFTQHHSNAMKQFALDMLLAGTHDKPRVIEVIFEGRPQTIELDKKVFSDNATPLMEAKLLSKNKAYLKINNCLWNNDLISSFDQALDSLINYPILILDLTDTPSGGNSTVARAIMGRFITAPMPYQQHEYDEKDFETKRHWIEYVYPRKKTFQGKLIVLVGHWTGSMGEGMAIGFDSFKKPLVVGTKMAGLLGAIEGFNLKETNINFQIPTERLYHVNGKPRENYTPKIQTTNEVQTWSYILKVK